MPIEATVPECRLQRVLIVEDEPATSTAVQTLLEHYGFAVSHAPTTAAALAQLHTKPDYVILDLGLPDGDGSRVLEQIRVLQMPTIVAVVTGSTDPQRLQRVRRLRPDMMLPKPLDFLSLLQRMKPSK